MDWSKKIAKNNNNNYSKPIMSVHNKNALSQTDVPPLDPSAGPHSGETQASI